MDHDLIKFEREVYKPSMPLMGKWFDNTQDFNSNILSKEELIEMNLFQIYPTSVVSCVAREKRF